MNVKSVPRFLLSGSRIAGHLLCASMLRPATRDFYAKPLAPLKRSHFARVFDVTEVE